MQKKIILLYPNISNELPKILIWKKFKILKFSNLKIILTSKTNEFYDRALFTSSGYRT